MADPEVKDPPHDQVNSSQRDPTPALVIDPVTGAAVTPAAMMRLERFGGKRKDFTKGQPRPNGAGRPKQLPRLRKRCRKMTFELLDEIKELMACVHEGMEGYTVASKSGDPVYVTPSLGERAKALADLAKAFNLVAPHGGFLPSHKVTELDLAKARLVVAAMAIEGLKIEDRKKLLEALDDTSEK